ncbi:hypothetical protein [Sutcliffiella halmapala]|uniref:hypothetical protein n=1 Tax=Sutcliffiella halmapala TaxID=79882 RepID=UPI000995A4FE|nr:hypothetical protein [Sutcliffiella halmapala]
MEYIIDEANIVRNEKSFVTSSLLIKDNKIQFMKDVILSKKMMRMNLSPYVMTPGHVMVVDDLPFMTFQQYKSYIIENYIRKGCTTLLSVFTIHTERELAQKLKEARTHMLNSPIDYYFALRIPLQKLTPSLIRHCKRYKIPAILLEIEEDSDLQNIPWGWMKDALYQFPIAFIPCLRNKPANIKGLKKTWKTIMKEEKLPHLIECPEAGKPLSLDVLMKLGIYPTKGDLRVGGELNYNLYIYPEDRIIETIEDLDYDSHIPEITVHQGNVIKVGKKISFRPGFGNECTVTIPGHFLQGRGV